MTRFNLVVPWFKAGKMYFPEEMKETQVIGEFMTEIQLATVTGFKGKDDCLDTISMLQNLTPWKPSEDAVMTEDSSMVGHNGGPVWADEETAEDENMISSYIV